ncbi:MAG: glycosyltransferase family 4 protein [Deltaproteobacteria bacterium]|nr:glycosyltransferase family 4 protein [Deltaproteobacteria bacterium]
MEIASHLQRAGAEIYLMPVTDHKTPPDIWPAEQLIEVRPARIHYLLDGLGVARSVRKFAASNPVDMVLGWQHEAAFLPGLAPKMGFLFGMLAAFPYGAWSGRDTRWRTIKQLSDEFFRCRPLKKASIVFTPSEFTRQELISLIGIPKEKIQVAPLGVDSVFNSIQHEPRSAIRNFIFFGSLASIKGVQDAVSALGQVKKDGYFNWKLKIAGWGDREQLMELIRQYGIESQVEFLGALNRCELVDQLAWAQVAVLPSYSESFGLSIAEAQASGLPVIAYRAGAVPEVVKHGSTGLLVPRGDVAALVGAIIQAFENPERFYQMGLAGREHVRARFSWEKSAQIIHSSLLSLTGARRS